MSAIFLPLVAFTIFLSSPVQAQNITKYYTSSQQENGTLYFVMPQEGFEAKGGNELVYDVTYLTAKDSAIFNFSYFDKSNLDIESITLSSPSKTITAPVEKLFVETKKDKWHYRYSSKIRFEDLEALYGSSQAPTLTMATKDSPIVCKMKTSEWKKQSVILSKIFVLINYNRKK